MADAAGREIWLKVIKRASKEGTKLGLQKMDVPDRVASGIADQYAVAYDLVSKGRKLTPTTLGIILTEKGLGLAKMGAEGHGAQCTIAVAIVGIGFLKACRAAAAAAATEGALTMVFVMEVAELMEKLYTMDKKCGISEAVVKKVESKTLPAYIWLEGEIVKALFRGY